MALDLEATSYEAIDAIEGKAGTRFSLSGHATGREESITLTRDQCRYCSSDLHGLR